MDNFLHFWYFKLATVHTCQFPERKGKPKSFLLRPRYGLTSTAFNRTATSNKIRERRVDFTILSVMSAPFASKLPAPTRNVDHSLTFTLFLRFIPAWYHDGPSLNGHLGSFVVSHVILACAKLPRHFGFIQKNGPVWVPSFAILISFRW